MDYIYQSVIIGLLIYSSEMFVCQQGLVNQRGEHYGNGDSYHSMKLNEKLEWKLIKKSVYLVT